MRHVALTALLLAGLSGCLGDGPPSSLDLQVLSPIEVATDAAGDARALNHEYLDGLAYRPCDALPAPAADPCAAMAATVQAIPKPEGAGVPEPQLDLLSASFQETSGALIVSVSVAMLDEAWSGVASDGTNGGYGACWAADGDADGATECVTVAASRPEGQLVLEATFDRYALACNVWWWCSWRVPFEVAYGEPATVTWTLPRALLGAGDKGSTLTDIRIESFRSQAAGPAVHWGAADAGGEVDMSVDHYHPDLAFGPEPFVFQTPKAAAAVPTGPAVDAQADAASADLDILGLALRLDADTATVSIELARVDAEPDELHLAVGLGLASRRVFELGLDVTEGAQAAWGGACTDDTCGTWGEVPVTVALEAGSPGRVHLTAARADLDAPQPGDLVNLFYATSHRWETRTPGVAPAHAWTGHDGDWLAPAPPTYVG